MSDSPVVLIEPHRLPPFPQLPGYAWATTYAEVITPAAIASGTSPVAVSWTAKRKDNAALWDGATKLIVKQDGTYCVSAFLDWGTNTTGVRLMWLKLNGATLFSGDGVTPTAQGSPSSCDGLIDMKKGDYVEVYAVQNSGGNLTPTGFFTAVRVSTL